MNNKLHSSLTAEFGYQWIEKLLFFTWIELLRERGKVHSEGSQQKFLHLGSSEFFSSSQKQIILAKSGSEAVKQTGNFAVQLLQLNGIFSLNKNEVDVLLIIFNYLSAANTLFFFFFRNCKI